MVQAQRTSSNLLEPHHHRDSKVCRVLSHEFGVVRLYRTFYNTRGSRCVWYLYTCSGWFNSSEPLRTFMNRFNTEKARCVEVSHRRSKWSDYTEPFRITYSQGIKEKARYVEVSHMSSRWFDYTEPHLHKGIKVCSGVQGLVRGGSSTSNLLEPFRTTSLQRWQGVLSCSTITEPN